MEGGITLTREVDVLDYVMHRLDKSIQIQGDVIGDSSFRGFSLLLQLVVLEK